MTGFDTIVQAIEMARQALKPGVKGVEIDRIARDYIVSQGYEEYPHGLGQPASWIDTRWTGVLEKREGRWRMVPMHFSHPVE